MTSEGLGEMFEDDSADTCARKFPLMLMGDERTVQRAQTVIEDPHRRERKLDSCIRLYGLKIWVYQNLLHDKYEGVREDSKCIYSILKPKSTNNNNKCENLFVLNKRLYSL